MFKWFWTLSSLGGPVLLRFSFYDGRPDLWISEQQRWVAGFLPGKVMLQSRESVVEIKVFGHV